MNREQEIDSARKTARDVKDMWARFRGHGSGSVTTAELRRIRQDIVGALPLLKYHPDAGAMRRVAVQDLSTIENYLAARKQS